MPLRWRGSHFFEFYAGVCDKLHRGRIPTPGYAVARLNEPHGVTGHIIPWNYPMQIFRAVGGRTCRRQRLRGEACRGRLSSSLLRIAELVAECGRKAQ